MAFENEGAIDKINTPLTFSHFLNLHGGMPVAVNRLTCVDCIIIIKYMRVLVD